MTLFLKQNSKFKQECVRPLDSRHFEREILLVEFKEFKPIETSVRPPQKKKGELSV